MLIPAEVKVFPDLEALSRQAADQFARLATRRVAALLTALQKYILAL